MTSALPTIAKCRFCGCKLNAGEGDDYSSGVCSSCKTHPDTRRAMTAPARGEFTPAEKSLIRKLHGLMPAAQLLALLNDRRLSDLGTAAAPYAADQLHAEIANVIGNAPAGGHDWASIRTLLAKARRAGTLDAVTEQVIDDFAVVFSCNPKQVLALKDILLRTKEDE